MKWLNGFLINLQFFSSIPVNVALPMDKEHLDKSIRTFPLLGLLQGGIYAFLLYAVLEWTPFTSLAAAFAVWLAAIILTGGIHLDGWMDASDAFFSYRSHEKRLEIMKDPRVGAFGVLSVLVLLSMKFFFIYEIVLKIQTESYLLVAMIPVFGKLAMGFLLVTVKPARNEGLGVLFRNAASGRTLLIYPAYLLVYLAFAAAGGQLVPAGSFILAIVLIVLFLRKKIVSWFGGMTGDLLGASTEGAEVLLWMTLWLLHYSVMG
ncbi:adenosylcobinamide-GDP ribazoletransferase [Bacillus sp. REN3]|uniref:adenosylcobinamide-GDP ribazoletransferase n=1 Tax=Bacillus sp. REN3 TaxID=2802440 RepID=UPI001AED95E1|nr:adenosylcobinamide-GDP ribazoletransferase [Bacillus sp. REN3]